MQCESRWRLSRPLDSPKHGDECGEGGEVLSVVEDGHLEEVGDQGGEAHRQTVAHLQTQIRVSGLRVILQQLDCSSQIHRHRSQGAEGHCQTVEHFEPNVSAWTCYALEKLLCFWS